jgi:hypothetical protein
MLNALFGVAYGLETPFFPHLAAPNVAPKTEVYRICTEHFLSSIRKAEFGQAVTARSSTARAVSVHSVQSAGSDWLWSVDGGAVTSAAASSAGWILFCSPSDARVLSRRNRPRLPPANRDSRPNRKCAGTASAPAAAPRLSLRPARPGIRLDSLRAATAFLGLCVLGPLLAFSKRGRTLHCGLNRR